MELRTKRVQWGNLSVIVREQNGMDTFKEPHLFWTMVGAVFGEHITDQYQLSLIDRTAIHEMTAMVSRTVETQGFTWPKPESDAESFKQGYETLQCLAGGFVRLWRDALIDLNTAPLGDPDLAPPKTLSEKKKKAP